MMILTNKSEQTGSTVSQHAPSASGSTNLPHGMPGRAGLLTGKPEDLKSSLAHSLHFCPRLLIATTH
jgi:hypothetical protein